MKPERNLEIFKLASIFYIEYYEVGDKICGPPHFAPKMGIFTF